MAVLCNVRKLLDRKGKSQRWLAKESGISEKQISSLSTGKQKQIALHNIERLCVALECTIGQLFDVQTDHLPPLGEPL